MSKRDNYYDKEMRRLQKIEWERLAQIRHGWGKRYEEAQRNTQKSVQDFREKSATDIVMQAFLGEDYSDVAVKVNKVGEDLPESRYARRSPEDDDLGKPKCPDHGSEMKFISSRGLWKCPEQGCRKAARPREETFIAGGSKAKILDEDLELVILGKMQGMANAMDMKYFLRSKKYNVMIPLSKVINDVRINGEQQAMTGEVILKGLPLVLVDE